MKESRKTRYTKHALKEAMSELLKEKKVSEISIRELCALSDLNRSTFYAHYEDIYSLFSEMEDEMAEQMPIILNGGDIYASMYEFLGYCQDHFEMINVFASQGHLAEKMDQRSADLWNQNETHSPQEEDVFRFLSAFFTNGLFHSLIWWMSKESSMSQETAARIIAKIFEDITDIRLGFRGSHSAAA